MKILKFFLQKFLNKFYFQVHTTSRSPKPVINARLKVAPAKEIRICEIIVGFELQKVKLTV